MKLENRSNLIFLLEISVHEDFARASKLMDQCEWSQHPWACQWSTHQMGNDTGKYCKQNQNIVGIFELPQMVEQGSIL